MCPSRSSLSLFCRLLGGASLTLLLVMAVPGVRAQSAYVRVSQVGYETGEGPFRAYLMLELATNVVRVIGHLDPADWQEVQARLRLAIAIT